MKMVEWDKANPEPQGKRAKRRHIRKWHAWRDANVMESWGAQREAEDKFQYALVAVANVTPRDHHDLIVKAAASIAYDDVRAAGYLRNETRRSRRPGKCRPVRNETKPSSGRASFDAPADTYGLIFAKRGRASK